ncbi:hypothetical protein AB0L00_08895 [Actinoallomurus sp. NPDC052308]|uniref:hypothetical protein n=1 Tax=Actinoallomurus sp. NPDC052308 TaxID=3155530 RepID=UPI0034277ED5
MAPAARDPGRHHLTEAAAHAGSAIEEEFENSRQAAVHGMKITGWWRRLAEDSRLRTALIARFIKNGRPTGYVTKGSLAMPKTPVPPKPSKPPTA